MMIVPEDDGHIWQMLPDRSLQIAQANGLESHLGVVKILDRWLNEDDFHGVPLPE
jgi:hypothetical protein